MSDIKSGAAVLPPRPKTAKEKADALAKLTEEEKKKTRCCFTGHRPQKLHRPIDDIKVDLENEILAAIKDGYTRKRVDGKVLTLKNPGPDWSGKLLWPKQGEVLIQLARTGEKKSAEATAQQPTAPTGLRRVILGGASGGAPASAGTLTVYCNIPGSDLFIDRRYAGTTPLQVVLSAGPHTIQIQKPGLAPVRKDIHITEDTELIYRANLAP